MILDPSSGQARARVVFDTNVVVALLVFDDPTLADLRARWEQGQCVALADGETLAELDRVLRYPELHVDEDRAASIARRYRERCILVAAPGASASARATRLPQCRDPDDQKFLVLAQRGNATALLTRDKALLSMKKRLPFVVATPDALMKVTPLPARALPGAATE